jgi:hypothetical protein
MLYICTPEIEIEIEIDIEIEIEIEIEGEKKLLPFFVFRVSFYLTYNMGYSNIYIERKNKEIHNEKVLQGFLRMHSFNRRA